MSNTDHSFDIIAASTVTESCTEADLNERGESFNPNTETILIKYLFNKLAGRATPVEDVIRHIDSQKGMPPDANQIPPSLFCHGGENRSAYFYICAEVVLGDVKTERPTSNGYWKLLSNEQVHIQTSSDSDDDAVTVVHVGNVRTWRYYGRELRRPMRTASETCFKIREYYLNPELEPTTLIVTGLYLGCFFKKLCVCEFIDEDSELRLKQKCKVASLAISGGDPLFILPGHLPIGPRLICALLDAPKPRVDPLDTLFVRAPPPSPSSPWKEESDDEW
ncbi:hypothetical protein ACFX1X_046250 [Malus domestica]